MRIRSAIITLLASALLVLAASRPARAAEPSDVAAPAARSVDVRGELPIVAYTYSATGVPVGRFGAAGYGVGLTSSSKPILGGGMTAWGSPIDRLTLVGDGSRDVFGNFAPSLAAVVRLVGAPGRGFSLGALGKYKIDGFGTGPGGETESEMELGVLVSYSEAGLHLDANALAGAGLGDDGEIDSEGRLRVGYDLGSVVRLGVDGQARFRLNGQKRLPGDRTWDFAAGPQLLVGSQHFFGSLTAGPSTMGIADRSIGWTAMASVGGASF